MVELTLKETAKLMKSKDYKDRFRAELYQARIRYAELKSMLDNWDDLNFTPTCPKSILCDQLRILGEYVSILEKRGEIEGVKCDS